MSHIYIIAGSDPSGGAGIARDMRTVYDFNHSCSHILTSVTAQYSRRFICANTVAPSLISAQCDAILAERHPQAVKIGMLASTPVIEALLPTLRAIRSKNIPIICDTVCVSTSGGVLLDSDAQRTLMQALVPLSTLITPNIAEARQLTGMYEADSCADVFFEYGADAVLITGGDERPESSEVADILFRQHQEPRIFSHQRIPGGERTRGTGCMLSTAIACELSQHVPLAEAIDTARCYVKRQIMRRHAHIT